MQTQTKVVAGMIIIFLIVIVIVVVVFATRNNHNSTASEENVYCTLDAKLCPDGSYVGRVPPSCEFATCSSSTQEMEPYLNINAS